MAEVDEYAIDALKRVVERLTEEVQKECLREYRTERESRWSWGRVRGFHAAIDIVDAEIANLEDFADKAAS